MLIVIIIACTVYRAFRGVDGGHIGCVWDGATKCLVVKQFSLKLCVIWTGR